MSIDELWGVLLSDLVSELKLGLSNKQIWLLDDRFLLGLSAYIHAQTVSFLIMAY